MSKNQNYVSVAAVLLSVLVGFACVGYFVGSPIPTKTPARLMVLNSWAYQGGDYDQGFDTLEVYTNETGSWVLLETIQYDDANPVLEVSGGAFIRVYAYVWLNSTLVSAGSSAQGKLYQITNSTLSYYANSSIAYSSGNFTYVTVDTGIDPPLWLYTYSHVYNYALAYGETYIVNLSYYTYW